VTQEPFVHSARTCDLCARTGLLPFQPGLDLESRALLNAQSRKPMPKRPTEKTSANNNPTAGAGAVPQP
jgi:hypothetical protein